MEIKNLAQLKRVIQEKREFIIRVHRQEKFLGQKRIPNVVQSLSLIHILTLRWGRMCLSITTVQC